jgi:hypothetical protein
MKEAKEKSEKGERISVSVKWNLVQVCVCLTFKESMLGQHTTITIIISTEAHK